MSRRLALSAAVIAVLCMSCSTRRVRHRSFDPPQMNWDWQTPVLESRQAWDDATGRSHQYQGFGTQLAR